MLKQNAFILLASALCCVVLFSACPVENKEPEKADEQPESSVFYPVPGSVSAYPDGGLMVVFDNPSSLPLQLKQGAYIEIYEDGNLEPVDRIRVFTNPLNVEGDSTAEDKGERQNFVNGDEFFVANRLTRIIGNTLYVTPHNGKLEYNKKYSVVVPEEVCEYPAFFNGDYFTGIKKGEWTFSTRAAPVLDSAKPITINNAITDNTADFHSIDAMLRAIKGKPGTWTIDIAPGLYNECIRFTGGNDQTLILNGTGTEKYGKDVLVEFMWYPAMAPDNTTKRGLNFIEGLKELVIKNITFVNVDNRVGGQAEVLNTGIDPVVVYNCGFHGRQDTLLISGRSWFYKCYIEGDTDFIWGYPRAVLFEECEIVNVRQRAGVIFASRAGSYEGMAAGRFNKGFIALNSLLRNEYSSGVNFARTQSGIPASADQVAIINCTLEGTWNSNPWDIGHTDGQLDNGVHVGYKLYNLKNSDNTPWNTDGVDTRSSIMTDDLYNSEYNGRYAIFNRHYVHDTDRYAFMSEEYIWDPAPYEAEFNATPDPSRDNEYSSVTVQQVVVEPATTLAAGQSVVVNAQVLPADAEVKTITWSSGDPSTVSIDNTGKITGLKVGTATITAAATDGSNIVGTCVVTVRDDLTPWEHHWNFQTNPAGWTEHSEGTGGYSKQPTDADYGNGMKLLGNTGSDVGIYTTVAAPSFDSEDYPFTVGWMRCRGGKVAEITGTQGPYTLTINFSGAGDGPGRYPTVTIGTVTYNADATAPGHVPSDDTNPKQLHVYYNGKDSPLVEIAMGGGRIHDIYMSGYKAQ